MKKIVLMMLAFAATVFGAEEAAEIVKVSVETDANGAMIAAYSMIAAGVGLGLAALGGAIGMGNTAAATIAGTARNPGLGGKLMTTMFIALAMIEAQVIYTLVIALIALYANPYLTVG